MGAFFSPTDGLVKVEACGKRIDSGDTGADLRETFERISDGVSRRYGKPTQTFDYCHGIETECEDQFFMMSLNDKNRTLANYWIRVNAENHVQAIRMEAVVMSVTRGFIVCGFELEGFDKFAESNRATEDLSY